MLGQTGLARSIVWTCSGAGWGWQSIFTIGGGSGETAGHESRGGGGRRGGGKPGSREEGGIVEGGIDVKVVGFEVRVVVGVVVLTAVGLSDGRRQMQEPREDHLSHIVGAATSAAAAAAAAAGAVSSFASTSRGPIRGAGSMMLQLCESGGGGDGRDEGAATVSVGLAGGRRRRMHVRVYGGIGVVDGIVTAVVTVVDGGIAGERAIERAIGRSAVVLVVVVVI